MWNANISKTRENFITARKTFDNAPAECLILSSKFQRNISGFLGNKKPWHVIHGQLVGGLNPKKKARIMYGSQTPPASRVWLNIGHAKMCGSATPYFCKTTRQSKPTKGCPLTTRRWRITKIKWLALRQSDMPMGNPHTCFLITKIYKCGSCPLPCLVTTRYIVGDRRVTP